MYKDYDQNFSSIKLLAYVTSTPYTNNLLLSKDALYLVELVESPRLAIWFCQMILEQPVATVAIFVVFFVDQRVTTLQFAMDLYRQIAMHCRRLS